MVRGNCRRLSREFVFPIDFDVGDDYMQHPLMNIDSGYVIGHLSLLLAGAESMSRCALARVTSYRRSPQREKQQRSIIRVTRMLRIRQSHGLNLSTGISIWPLRADPYINSG